METNLIFGVSLTASFLAGVLALFAPCCITFLFPSYLGTIFKEREKVMFYTLIFGLGLSVILIPVALGFRFFIYFFDQFHKTIYYLGGVLLIIIGMMTAKPFIVIPQIFRFNPAINKKVNTASVFSLGLISGLTSSCCAPVLVAAITLTTLSPSLFQALIVSFAYVLGIILPLFVLSLIYKKTTNKISGGLKHKIHQVFVIIGTVIFSLSGILIIIFTYLNKIQMYQIEGYSRSMRLSIFQIGKYFQNPIIDILSFILILLLIYKLFKKRL